MMIHMLYSSISEVSLNPTFEKVLRKHKLDDDTIKILRKQKVNDIAAVRSLTESDVRDLGLPIGQKVLLRELVIKLRASSGEMRHEDTTEQMGKGQDKSTRNADTGDEKEISEEQFWCIFRCLGGISAVGIGGILALIGLVTYGLPLIGFGAAGIVAGSLAAKIMALYGGTMTAGSVVSVLQSVAAVGISWKAILGAFFGSAAVMTAIKKTCSHCMDQ
ncbi:hypothetical protein ACJMK2_026800 [Sinanodonta woodiana]|uniref:SAM domain-containing protein n=1 Tax=Sinanodonta woodiana TaxID=1069815 RepID=A0ABD3XL28_SINWO